jgi:hypothetical protein
MPKHGVCAEIGVWKGDFSAEILRLNQPAKLHLIDPWKYQAGEEYQEALYGGGMAKSQGFMDTVWESVLARFATEIERGLVEVHRGFSEQLAPEFRDEYFDWVYIDGNHLYEFVKRDLESFYPKVRPGGFLAGDDYHNSGWWDGGVKRAVDAFVDLGLAEVVSTSADQFVLQKA